MNFAWRVYRRLAQAFPHEFKLAYGADVMQLGEDVVEDVAKRHGVAGLIRLIADIAVRVPLEYLNEMRGDMLYAWRGLRKSPGFALVGIVSMGLGMGLTTVVYSSKWQVVSRDLPAAANAKRLVMAEKPVSYYYVEQFREEKNLFTGVAAMQTGIPFSVTLQGHATPERVFGQLVSADYFSVLGVQPQHGRVFSSQLDKPGDAPVVVISNRFWRNRLNSSPDAVGETLRLNGQLATIVGITPRNFNGAFALNPSELFVPITVPAALAPELANDVLHQRHAKEFVALVCLAPGVTLEPAEAALDAIARRLDEQDPSIPARTDNGRRVTLWPAGTMAPLPRTVKLVVLGFFALLMTLIMTVACMNQANMLLARGANRSKEFAIRLAVGASRFRIVRQLLAEGILLSVFGGLAGFGLGYLISSLNSKLPQPMGAPTESDFTPDWHAALFVFAIAIVCGVGFSLAPALRATKADTTLALKEGTALLLPGYLRFGLRNLLMVAQVAGSLMLLLITGFLVIGIHGASRIRTKFDPDKMVLLSLDPIRDGYSPQKAQALFEKLGEQIKATGSVSSIALAAQAPFSQHDPDDASIQLSAENSRGNSRVQHAVVEETIGAGYFAVLSEPMLAGREFAKSDQRSEADGAKALPVVLNETATRAFFGNGNAVGQRLRGDNRTYEVVGVTRDLKFGLGVTPALVYLPLTARVFARPPIDGIIMVVRSDAGSDALSGIRREIAVIDPNLNLFNVRTFSEYLELSRSSERSALNTYGGMGVFGLVLAAIGLAGVTAYAVAQRRKEIGIRMALGARKGQVLRLVLREGAVLISAGTIVGFLGAFALARVLMTLAHELVESFSTGTADPRLLVGAPLLLAAVAMLACYVPARRATQIDPLKALRQE